MPSKRVSLKGKGADLFFGEEREEQPVAPPLPTEPSETAEMAPAPARGPEPSVSEPVERDAPPREDRRDMSAQAPEGDGATRRRARARANTPARVPADEVELAETIEAIRKTVKEVGREVSFTLLSPTEKGRLVDIVYTYKRQGVKTSENEINRIAINLLLSDYETNGDASVLARVLAALQA